MTKTAEWTQVVSSFHTGEEEERKRRFSRQATVYLQCWSSKSSWRKVSFWDSLFPSLQHQRHADKICVCVCVWTHTWTFPTQNFAKHVCTSWEEGIREGGWGRNLTRYWREGEREKARERRCVCGGVQKEERKISLLCSCCYGNPLDNTYSLCHSGMKESDELTPFYSPCKNARSLCENHTGLPPSFVSSWGTTPSRSLSLPLSIHSRKKKERERDKNDPVS